MASEVLPADRPDDAPTMASGMQHANNYYYWVMSQFTGYIGERVLDIGGGYGTHLESIIPLCKHLTTLDLSMESVQFLRERFSNQLAFEARQFDFGRDNARDFLTTQRFDTVTCLNVLEHIGDDLAALRDIHAVLHLQQGYLCLQVPAHRWLYGSLDHQAGHFRRYTASSLKALLLSVGFQIVRLYYFNAFGVVPWFINARVLKKDIETDGVNTQIRLFDRYFVPVLRWIETGIKPPMGQSLIAVARATQSGTFLQ